MNSKTEFGLAGAFAAAGSLSCAVIGNLQSPAIQRHPAIGLLALPTMIFGLCTGLILAEDAENKALLEQSMMEEEKISSSNLQL